TVKNKPKMIFQYGRAYLDGTEAVAFSDLFSHPRMGRQLFDAGYPARLCLTQRFPALGICYCYCCYFCYRPSLFPFVGSSGSRNSSSTHPQRALFHQCRKGHASPPLLTRAGFTWMIRRRPSCTNRTRLKSSSSRKAESIAPFSRSPPGPNCCTFFVGTKSVR